MASRKRRRVETHTSGDLSPQTTAVAIDTEFGRFVVDPLQSQIEKQALLDATHYFTSESDRPEIRQSISHAIDQSNPGIAGAIWSKLQRIEISDQSLQNSLSCFHEELDATQYDRRQAAAVLQRSRANQKAMRPQHHNNQMAVQTPVGVSQVRIESRQHGRHFIEEQTDTQSSPDSRWSRSPSHGDRASHNETHWYGRNELDSDRQIRQVGGLDQTWFNGNNHRREDTDFQQELCWNRPPFHGDRASQYQTHRYGRNERKPDRQSHQDDTMLQARSYVYRHRQNANFDDGLHSLERERGMDDMDSEAVYPFREQERLPASLSGHAARNMSSRPRDGRLDQRSMWGEYAAEYDDASLHDESRQQTPGFHESSNSVRNQERASSDSANVLMQREAPSQGRAPGSGTDMPSSRVRNESDTGWVSLDRVQAAVTVLVDQSVSTLTTKKTKPHLTRLLGRADRFTAGHCIQCDVIVHKKAQCAFTSPMQACTQCIKARRPCAKLIEIDGQAYTSWLPVPGSDAQWGEVSFWKP